MFNVHIRKTYMLDTPNEEVQRDVASCLAWFPNQPIDVHVYFSPITQKEMERLLSVDDSNGETGTT